MFMVPFGGQAHPLFKWHGGSETQLVSGAPDIINAIIGEKSHTAAGEGRIFAFDAGYKGKNVGGQIGQPEGDVALWQRPAQCMGDGFGQFAKRDGVVSGDVVAVADGLRAFSTQQEGGGHVVDVDGMNQRPAATNQTGAPLFNGGEEAEQVKVAGAIHQSRARHADGQAIFLPGLQGEQFSFQLALYVGIGGRVRGILSGGRFARHAVNARCAAMHDTLQRTLALTRI